MNTISISATRLALLTLASIVAIACSDQPSNSEPVEPQPSVMEEQVVQQVPIPGTQRHLLYSAEIGQHFTIDVAVPNGTFDQPLPVIYLTDGNWMFPMVQGTLQLLRLGEEVPAAILVGIGYPNATLNEVAKLRTRDLTPSVDANFIKSLDSASNDQPPTVKAGGADAFLHFIDSQVKPFIHANYNAHKNNDILMGDSLGGLFTLHALFTRTEEYRRYIVGSPSLWWDAQSTFATEIAYAESHDDLDVDLFISVGGFEEGTPFSIDSAKMVTNMRKMANTLRGRDYPSLRLTEYEFDKETHYSVIPATWSRGLREVFGTEKSGL